MVTKTVAIYTFFDDILKSMNYKEAKNRQVSDSEASTIILIAAMYFGGNMETAMSFVRSTGLMPQMLSKSRFNRRIYKIGELLAELFFYTGEAIKTLNINQTYSIDSFQVVVCHNIRITTCRIVKGKEHRGYNASKRTYFYEFKVHLLVIADGIPVEYTLTTGNRHDLDGTRHWQRKRVETTFSDIAKLLLKSIHTVTKEGFIIKLITFTWAYTFNNFHKL